MSSNTLSIELSEFGVFRFKLLDDRRSDEELILAAYRKFLYRIKYYRGLNMIERVYK